jgi:hypothetical protein
LFCARRILVEIREASARGEVATARRAETSKNGVDEARVRLRPQDQALSFVIEAGIGETAPAEIGADQPRIEEKREVV